MKCDEWFKDHGIDDEILTLSSFGEWFETTFTGESPAVKDVITLAELASVNGPRGWGKWLLEGVPSVTVLEDIVRDPQVTLDLRIEAAIQVMLIGNLVEYVYATDSSLPYAVRSVAIARLPFDSETHSSLALDSSVPNGLRSLCVLYLKSTNPALLKLIEDDETPQEVRIEAQLTYEV